MNPRNVGAVEV